MKPRAGGFNAVGVRGGGAGGCREEVLGRGTIPTKAHPSGMLVRDFDVVGTIPTKTHPSGMLVRDFDVVSQPLLRRSPGKPGFTTLSLPCVRRGIFFWGGIAVVGDGAIRG